MFFSSSPFLIHCIPSRERNCSALSEHKHSEWRNTRQGLNKAPAHPASPATAAPQPYHSIPYWRLCLVLLIFFLNKCNAHSLRCKLYQNWRWMLPVSGQTWDNRAKLLHQTWASYLHHHSEMKAGLVLETTSYDNEWQVNYYHQFCLSGRSLCNF